MGWRKFYHPDYSFTVIRRKVADEVLDTVEELGDLLLTSGQSYLRGWNQKEKATGYRSALYRLHKAGLIARRPRDGGAPVLQITPRGAERRDACLRPTRYWNRKWDGRWYVLMYDVPEKQRPYRDSLRAFLERLRLGCLQNSVWITPWDIRPEFADLSSAAAVHNYAYLFVMETVLGRDPVELAQSAWPFYELHEKQQWYLTVYTENLAKLKEGGATSSELLDLARSETNAYSISMQDDPLLPRILWPSDYLGEQVFVLHRQLIQEVRARL